MQFVWQFSCFPSIYLHTVFQYWVLITWCIYMFSSSSFLLCRFSAIASRDSQKVMVCNEGWQLWYFPLISLHTVWRIKIYQETCRSCIKSQQASIVVSLSDVIAFSLYEFLIFWPISIQLQMWTDTGRKKYYSKNTLFTPWLKKAEGVL